MPISACPLLTMVSEFKPRSREGLVPCITTTCAWYVLGSESGRCAIQAIALGLFGVSKKMETKNAQQRPAR
jgi:hypothetical protein